MRKLLTLWIALATVALAAPAYADTIKSTFDFGPAASDRVAVVGFTCKSCFGARSVSVNGVELKRDVSSVGAEVAEIWSAPLPEGSGPLTIIVSSDHAIDASDVLLGVLRSEPNKVSELPTFREASAGKQQYHLDVTYGDSVFAISRGQRSITGTRAPSQRTDAEFSRSACWDIDRADPPFSISETSTVSAVAIYR
jgi:hypothetical protein